MASKAYGFKRVDTMLRKWNAKAIKKGVLKSFASSIEVLMKVSQWWLLPYHDRKG